MKQISNKRELLIYYLNKYIKKKHVKMKTVFKYYKDLLLEDKNLKVKYFKHLIPFLLHEVNDPKNKNETYLLLYFQELIEKKSNNSTTTTTNLNQFFI